MEKGFLQLSIIFLLSLCVCVCVCVFLRKTYFLSVVLNWMEDSFNPVCAKSCPTLCDPMDCSSAGSSVQRIVQPRILERATTSFSRGSSDPGVEPMYRTLAGGFFSSEPPGKPKPTVLGYKIKNKVRNHKSEEMILKRVKSLSSLPFHKASSFSSVFWSPSVEPTYRRCYSESWWLVVKCRYEMCRERQWSLDFRQCLWQEVVFSVFHVIAG